MSISPELGVEREIELEVGPIRYREIGDGPAILFVHGLLVNGDLWRKVVPLLAPNYRCIIPDWPLGSHSTAMKRDADLSIPNLSRTIAEFSRALELHRPTIVANDTGGALTQCLMTQQPEACGAVVLTSCDCFDNFLPPLFRPLQWLAHIPPLLTVLVQFFRWPPMRRLPNGYGWLARRTIDPVIEANYLASLLGNSGVRRDCFKVLRAIHPRYTQQAAARLGAYSSPVLVAWAAQDRFFPLEHGRRLAKLLPNARFQTIDDSYTFLSEDQPEALAKTIDDFLASLPAELPPNN